MEKRCQWKKSDQVLRRPIRAKCRWSLGNENAKPVNETAGGALEGGPRDTSKVEELLIEPKKSVKFGKTLKTVEKKQGAEREGALALLTEKGKNSRLLKKAVLAAARNRPFRHWR